MRLPSFAVVFVALATQTACQGGAPPETPRPAPASSADTAPTDGERAGPSAESHVATETPVDAGASGLARFCSNAGGCGDYDAELAALRARASTRTCFVVERGTCGAYRYLDEVPGGLLGTLRYFDASGKLVAATQYNVEHPGRTSFGAAVACARTKSQDLCANHVR